uniref:Integrase catalytic domain-containing protein n=1 Tax=Tanacetum cinerariifolium TaxID=118510 RepID=A0A6L2MNA8_TANCI|nr:hypothetical protein [Tanacetum cinerariifolium]
MDSIIPLGHKDTLAEYMILSGADNRPPMLDKDLYDSWKSQMELYMQSREHKRMILELVENGPLIWPTIKENGVTRTKKYAELSAVEKIQANYDMMGTNIILQDDPIACLNKAMAFLTAVASSRFPVTNNQLRTSSNLRNQATIQDGKVTVQQVQGRQGQSYYGLGIRVMLLVLGETMHLDRQGLLNATTVKVNDIWLDPGVPDGQNAKAILMANISNYGFDVLSEVIVNGDFVITVASTSTKGPIPPKTVEQKLAKKNELKSKSTLMLAIPDEHLLKFHACKDAKSIWEAIKNRFGGNKESKKMQKTILKQNYENFAASNQEGLDKTYDRSRQCMDDLYNNLKVYESEIKSQSSLSLNSHDVAFVFSDNTSNTNETVNTAHSVSATSFKNQASTGSYSNDIMFSFFSNLSNSSQLDNKDLEQIDTDDLEEIDLKWNTTVENENKAEKPRKFSQSPRAAVLRKSGQVPVNAAKQSSQRAATSVSVARHVKTVASRPNVNSALPTTYSYFKAHSPDQRIFDSGCSRYMTRNKSYLTDYQEIDGGFVAFGGNVNGGKITGKGKIRTGKLDFEDVYFMKELKFNLFSVSQMCDKKNSVLFTDTECVVLSADFKLLDESRVLFKVPRNNNMYSFDLKNIVPIRGLTCLFVKATLNESNLWHRRFGHINFKTMNKLVRETLQEGIRREFSIARTPQQNGVTERKNRTLIEIARTMLEDSKLPTTFWAEAVNTACYVQNRVLVIKPHNKTSYELFLGRKHVLSFMRPFGCPVTILNTLDKLGMFDGKSDDGFFIGYSINSKAFRVFNTRTKIIEENLHINFLEIKPNDAGIGPIWMFDIDTLTMSMNYQPVFTGNQTNGNGGTKANIDARQTRKKTVPSLQYVLLPLLTTDSQGPKSSEDEIANDAGKKRRDRTQRNEFEGMFGQDKYANDNRIFTPVTAAGSTYVYLGGSIPINDSRIFSGAYDDEVEGAEADFYNLELTTVVIPIPTTRIYKDHPIEIEAIGLILAYASFMEFIVYQMDVKSAFLYGTIEEDVYVCQPPGFEDPHFINKVYKVEKALYGLHQAPRAWFDAQEVSDEFYEGAYFLLRVAVKTASTPIETNKALLKDKEAEDVDIHLYRSMIRSWMYLTASRPDMMFAVYACVRFQVTPKVSHLHAVKNSDYAGASLDRKSTIGGCQFLGKRLISWQCKKQTLVANSTTKAEYVAAAIYTSCIEQFWASAKLKNVNGEAQIQALIDKKKVIITEASIRRDLRFKDEGGVDCLSNEVIFEQVTLMGFVQVFLNNQVEGMDRHNAIFVISSHTKKVFANVKREGKDFSGKVTPLFATMMVQAPEDMGKGSEIPTDTYHTPIVTQPSSFQPRRSKNQRGNRGNKLKFLHQLVRFLLRKVLDLEEAKTAQAKEITGLKKRVKKLEHKRKLRNLGLKRLRKVEIASRIESSTKASLGHQKDTSKQRRMIDSIDQDVEITLVDETQGRMNEEDMFAVNDLDGDEVIVDATAGENVEQSTKDAEKEVSTADLVTIAGEVVTTADIKITTAATTL